MQGAPTIDVATDSQWLSRYKTELTWTSLSQARRVNSPCVLSSANCAASFASAAKHCKLSLKELVRQDPGLVETGALNHSELMWLVEWAPKGLILRQVQGKKLDRLGKASMNPDVKTAASPHVKADAAFFQACKSASRAG